MIGEDLGNYRVLAPIGKGGMASVFIGEHKLLGNRVAIKVLQRRHIDNPAIERRFFNEAKVIAAIKHPNIVEIYDFGRAHDGSAYIVMELLEGETLRKRIRRGIMPERQSIIFSRQLASALAAAHNEGVIHRDLKPDNIFIIQDEEVELNERIKLLDFGIAKRFQELGPASEQTATGILVGTPAYMSPEQCKGLGNIDGRSDIYSLGVVLYRMVTNQLPFEAGGTGELIGKHLYIQPPSPRELNADISLTLEDIILRCLQKEPEDRFQSMSELVSALADANATTAIDAPPVIDEDSDTLNNAVPTPSGQRLAAQELSPPAVPAASASAIHRVASPVAIEEISATTLRTATGEKMSPLADVTLKSKRGWGFYAAVGAAAALLIGIVAMTAGSGASESKGKNAASPGAMVGDPPEPADDVTAVKGADSDQGTEPATADDEAARLAAEAKQAEAERARLEAEEAERARAEQERLEAEAKKKAAEETKRKELDKKRKEELEKQAELKRQAERERERKRKAEAERRHREAAAAAERERKRKELERRREEAKKKKKKKKKKDIPIVY